MNLRQLEVFHAIMSSASLTEAARRLNVSQPNVSTILKHTEAHLGMKLFQRIGGRLLPTPEAKILYADIDGIFARIATFNRLADSLRDGRSGALSIAASPTLADALLPRAIARFRETRPHVRLQLESLPTSQVAERVARQEVDMGVAYAPAEDTGTETDSFGSSQVACAMRADHPLAVLSEIGPRDLMDHHIITYAGGTPFGVPIERCFRRAGIPFTVKVEVTISITAFFLAHEGVGVAIIDPIVPISGAFPELVIRPFVPTIEIELRMLFPRDRARSRLTTQFSEILKQVAAEL